MNRAADLFSTLTKTHSHYSHYTMLGDYRVVCGICNKIVAFKDKQSLDRHLQTSFHSALAALKPDLKTDLRNIKTDTAAIRAAIAKPLSPHSSKDLQPTVYQEETGWEQRIGEEPKKLWFQEVVGIYRGNATGKEYIRYNNSFLKWHAIKHGKNCATESDVRIFV